MSNAAALMRSHMNGWIPFKSTIEQSTETITATTMIKQ